MTTTWIWKGWPALERDELYAILTLRQRVFVVEQACAFQDADGRDPACHHLWTVDGAGAVAAYLRVVPPGAHYAEPSLGRIVTAPEARGNGLGRAVVVEGIARTRALHGVTPIRIGAQLYLEHFYNRLGFSRASADYDEDGITHLEMLLP